MAFRLTNLYDWLHALIVTTESRFQLRQPSCRGVTIDADGEKIRTTKTGDDVHHLTR